jgi:putative zinc finger protein
MSTCHVQASAAIELYFYGELTRSERDAVELHLAACAECRRALEELTVIRTALELRPAEDAPPGGDWSGFMARLQDAVRADGSASTAAGNPAGVVGFRSPRLATVFAMAALITLVTISVLAVLRGRGAPAITQVAPSGASAAASPEPVPSAARDSVPGDSALAQVSGQHFERSKLVVLGLATKDPLAASGADWNYERTLATSLLNDTRLYRLAAEERGMKTLAGVMRDLELVLLQTSMSEAPDAESLAQLQRLIRRRDLLTKMEVVATAGLVP